MTRSTGKNAPRTRWTEELLEVLELMYPDASAESISDLIGISKTVIYRQAHRLGLQKSAAYNASAASGRIQRGRQHPGMLATQFKPGLVPWNKGTHFVSGGRSALTRFKPGARPLTWVPIGSFRVVNGNLERKENDLPGANHVRWHPVHRTLWIAANGPVPKGHMIVFRAGMQTAVLEEITLDRLECISRADNARRNHPRNKHPELARLVQLKGAITRQANRIAREAQAQQEGASA